MSDERCQFCRKRPVKPPTGDPLDDRTRDIHECHLGSTGIELERKFWACFRRIAADAGEGEFCLRCEKVVEPFDFPRYRTRPRTRRLYDDPKENEAAKCLPPLTFAGHRIGHEFADGKARVAPGDWFVAVTQVQSGVNHLPMGGAGKTPAIALGKALQQYGFGRRIGRGFDIAPTSRWLKAWAVLLLIENYNDHCGVLMGSPELLADPDSLLSCDIGGRMLDDVGREERDWPE